VYLDAKSAIDGNKDSFAHTRMGRGHWWSAQFVGGEKLVTKVVIENRRDCCGDRLRGTQVYIGRNYCGTLPNRTYTKRQYTVDCKEPVSGGSVVIRQNTTYTALQLAEVTVYGDDNCGHDETKNKAGAHKCSSSSECTGARTCSKYRWCQGKHECPKKEVIIPERKHYNLSKYAKGKCELAEDDLAEKMETTEQNLEACAEAAANAGAEFFFTNPVVEDNADQSQNN
jgi:hypothetical protein